MIQKQIMGGEIRIVMKGDKSTYQGKEKVARDDYIMIKLTSMKNPLFIDRTALKVIRDIQNDEDVKALIRTWV